MSKKKLNKKVWYSSEVDVSGNPILPPLAENPEDLEGLHEGELFLHNSDDYPSIWIRTKNGLIKPLIGGQSNTPSYWEVRELPNGDTYLYTSLPIVTQSGVTMYADGGILNLPSIYDGLPIDNNTIYWEDVDGYRVLKAKGGGGIAESVSWADITGKPEWLLDGKISYSEIEGTPDLSVYALNRSLSEYVTKTELTNLDYADKDWVKEYVVDINTGNITAITKQMVIDALGFTPISSSDIPTSLPNPHSLKFGSKLYDGSAPKTILASDLGITWDDILGRPTLLSSFTDDVVAGKYLPLSGGIITSSEGVPLNINSTAGYTVIGLQINGILYSVFGADEYWGTYLGVAGKNQKLGIKPDGTPYYNEYSLIHSGNIGSYALPLSGGTISGDVVWEAGTGNNTMLPGHIYRQLFDGNGNVYDHYCTGGGINTFANLRVGSNDNGGSYKTLRFGGDGTFTWDGKTVIHSGNIGSQSVNYAASAKCLTAQQATIDDFGSYLSTYGAKGLSVIVNTSGAAVGNIGVMDSVLNIGSATNRLGRFLFKRHEYSEALYWQSANDTGTGWGAKRTLAFTDSNVASATKATTADSATYAESAGNANALDNMDSTDFFRILGINNNIDDFGDDSKLNGIVYINADQGEAHNAPFSYGSVLSINHKASSWMIGCQSNGKLMYRHRWWSESGENWSAWKTIAFTDSNVASATKLATARTIWGQSFDGTGDVSGSLVLPRTIPIVVTDTESNTLTAFQLNGDNCLLIGQDVAKKGYETIIYGNQITFAYGNVGSVYNAALHISPSGNVGIGTTNPSAKLEVNGNVAFGGAATFYDVISVNRNGSSGAILNTSKSALKVECYNTYTSFNTYTGGGVSNPNVFVLKDNGNIGIGTTSPSQKLHVDGNILTTGGITMYSQRSLKNVVDERGLSLEELRTIKPTRYTWKDKRDNRIHFGGIADDIQQVLPEVVYNANGALTMDYGNAGFAIASSLIKPVVDHEQRIKVLEKENEELKQEIKRLRA